jgi:hypothetical protein
MGDGQALALLYEAIPTRFICLHISYLVIQS